MNKLLCVSSQFSKYLSVLESPHQSSDCIYVCVSVCSSRLVAEKRSELGEQVTKLRNGLFKISDTREKVEAMSIELEEAKKQVAEFQKQCDEYLSVIVQQKIEADKQQKVSTTIMFTCTQMTILIEVKN